MVKKTLNERGPKRDLEIISIMLLNIMKLIFIIKKKEVKKRFKMI